MFKRQRILLACASLAFSSTYANAGTIYGFSRIGANASQSLIDQLDISVELDNAGLSSNQVRFTFKNSGLASSITSIYFNGGPLLGISSITGAGEQVNFGMPKKAESAKFSGAPDWKSVVGNSAVVDAISPAGFEKNGIDTGESLSIVFDLMNQKTLADTVAAMELSLLSPGQDVTNGLRIGFHLQSINGSGGVSDKFINGPQYGTSGQVPEPASALIWGFLSFAGIFSRKRSGRR